MTALLERLQKLFGVPPSRGAAYPPELTVHAGLETETDPAIYVWDGLKRGADPAHPFIVFQHTLDGQGRYAAEGMAHPLTPGMTFAAIIPSAHVYSLPPDSTSWTFFFLIISHPYIVRRMIETQAGIGPLLLLSDDDPLLARAVTLFEGVSSRDFRDSWALEAALFDLLFEYERLAQRLLYPQAQRESLLAEVRRQVLAQPGRDITVTELAAARGLSRSHFSHQFKAATGLPPARWVRQVQLEEAARLLLDSSHKLETVARAAGFADANHLCKVFRRHYHLSPGEFRKQMR